MRSRSRPSGRLSTTSRRTSRRTGPAQLARLIEELPTARIDQVLTHPSGATDRLSSYERLEFLGDSVLELAIARALYEDYPEHEEGQLAKIRSHVVSRQSCAAVARDLGLDRLLLERGVGVPREELDRLARNTNVLAALLEAALAALYLELGLEPIQEAIVAAFRGRVEYAVTSHVDYKTELQELLARERPRGHLHGGDTEGPPHDRVFTAAASIDGVQAGVGSGRSKKEAEQEAAKEALAPLQPKLPPRRLSHRLPTMRIQRTSLAREASPRDLSRTFGTACASHADNSNARQGEGTAGRPSGAPVRLPARAPACDQAARKARGNPWFPREPPPFADRRASRGVAPPGGARLRRPRSQPELVRLMHLRAIKLRGFKSFPEAVEIRLEPGVAVVVGPNGSGKSNVADAIVWAAGSLSPSELRAEKADDVLFAGSGDRPAAAWCEVELLFDNEDGGLGVDFSEVSVTRRLHRGGEGQYLVNGAAVRRLDLVELLADAGLGAGMHSIVGQGKVEAVLASRPEERRALVEEAAGLGRFKQRRHRAELKLARVALDVDRARDLEAEVRKRLRPLALQASAAERAEKLGAELDAIRARLAQLDVAALDGRLAELEGRRTASAIERRRIDGKLESLLGDRQQAEDELADAAGRREEATATLYRLRSAAERAALRREIGAGARVPVPERALRVRRCRLRRAGARPARAGGARDGRRRPDGRGEPRARGRGRPPRTRAPRRARAFARRAGGATAGGPRARRGRCAAGALVARRRAGRRAGRRGGARAPGSGAFRGRPGGRLRAPRARSRSRARLRPRRRRPAAGRARRGTACRAARGAARLHRAGRHAGRVRLRSGARRALVRRGDRGDRSPRARVQATSARGRVRPPRRTGLRGRGRGRTTGGGGERGRRRARPRAGAPGPVRGGRGVAPPAVRCRRRARGDAGCR